MPQCPLRGGACGAYEIYSVAAGVVWDFACAVEEVGGFAGVHGAPHRATLVGSVGWPGPWHREGIAPVPRILTMPLRPCAYVCGPGEEAPGLSGGRAGPIHSLVDVRSAVRYALCAGRLRFVQGAAA